MNRSIATRGGVSVIAILGAALLLSGCTLVGDPASAVAPATTAPPTDDGVPAAAAGTPRDTSIAATCAGFTAVNTILVNARQDLQLATITEEQHSAIVASAYAGFMTLTGEDEQRGLKEEVAALTDYANPDESADVNFDPSSEGYYTLMQPIMEACSANLSEIFVFSTTGG